MMFEFNAHGDLSVKQPSSLINSLIFLIVDVLALCVIHRGLCALQGYYLYRQARAGRPIPLLRSRIPIITGELLRGTSRLSSLFVFANAAAIALAFAAALGVNGETVKKYTPLSNVSVI